MKSLKTFFYSFKKSLFDLKYYGVVSKASFSFSLKYLLFLVLIFFVIKTIGLAGAYIYNRPQITPQVNRMLGYAQDFYPEELELKVEKGQLSTNVKEPYIVELDKNLRMGEKKHFLTIDTQGTIEDYPYYNTYILATRNAVVYPSKSNNSEVSQTSVFYFRDMKNGFTFDRSEYDFLIDNIRPYASRAVFFVDWFVSFGLLFFLVFGSLFWTTAIMVGLLALTFVVWIVSLLLKKPYNYGDLYKMGMHAVTWPIIFGEAVRYFNLPVPNVYHLIFLVFMTVVLFKMDESKLDAKVKKAKKKS
jgi:hypothetical protein